MDTKIENTLPSVIVKEAAEKAGIPEGKIIELINFGIDDTFCDDVSDYSDDDFFDIDKDILTVKADANRFLSKIKELCQAEKKKKPNKGGGKRKYKKRKSKKRKSKHKQSRKSRKRSKTRRRR